LAAAEALVLAADAHPTLLTVAMQGQAVGVARELTRLLSTPGPCFNIRDDLDRAAAAGELPAGSADATHRLVVGAVLGLVMGQADHAPHRRQEAWDLMQGALLFGLGHLAALQRQR
jgi:hypothetical protein